ncbi:MAG TPA: PspA/IM30 family protein [Bryobacteraceae bacterium]|jgi:phage shock protein A|nr:PspA/IM30 family protein [Bryobacteraceae bacterium]
MTLLDRVAMLVRANLNDLVDKAENPEKLLRQLLLDMQNQYLQLKTQVAVAIAGQHQLEKQQQENAAAQQEWVRKAEIAVSKNEEALARVALERSLTFENAARKFAEQVADQKNQVELLRDSLQRLETKMAETKTRAEVLIAQHRRARLHAKVNGDGVNGDAAFERLEARVSDVEMMGEARRIAGQELDTEAQLMQLEKADRVDRMLAELKHRLTST